MSIMLTLDNEVIALDNFKISVNTAIEDKDISGNSSMTTSSEDGNKAIKLKISGTLGFTEEKMAARLFELSRMKEKDGSRKVFLIGNSTARVVKCRLVKFANNLSLTEQGNLLAWQVDFTLKEVRSVAELKEQQLQQPSNQSQQINQNQFAETLKQTQQAAI